MDCLFCRIARHEIPSEVVYEDASALAFLDIHPVAPGHAVVIPKAHAETILDAPDEALGPLFTAVKRTTEMIGRTLAPRGFTIGINHGRAGGQTVDHVHVHIIPRREGDGGASIHAAVHN